MMLRSGDLNLNRSVQAFGDSTMERLKQAMLQHEVIFRNQVCELHRLYWTQKNLMNELRVKVVHTDCPSSYSWLNKESEEKKNAFSKSSRAKESSLAGNAGVFEEFKDNTADLLKNHQREFSLPLFADNFIRNKGETPAFHHRVGNFGCKGVIDLESSTELEFHEVTNNQVFSGGCRAPTHNGAGLFGAQASVPCALVTSSIIGNDKNRMVSVIHLSEEHGGQLQEQKSALPYVGIGESCIDASVNKPRKKQKASPMLFDLNVPLEDDCSHDLKAILEQEKTNSSPGETSFVPKTPFSDVPAKISCENRTSYLICHGKDSKSDCSLNSKLAHNTTDDKIDFVSGCQIQAEFSKGSTDSSDQGFLTINSKSISSMDLYNEVKDNVDSSGEKLRSSSHSDIKRQDSNVTSSNSNKDSVTKPTNHEGSEEDTSSSHAIVQVEFVPPRNFFTECNSHGISRNNEFSNADDSVTTQLNSSLNEESLEWDTAIVAAAKALMSIPLLCSAIPADQSDGINTSNLPQYSSDSFERMTLQLCEVQNEDCSILEPPNGNETVKNERAVRLRRGRGFRDFQKDILPGLVTLSRHEICEDLHNIGYKLRRVRSRKSGDNWFVPVTSRRSKLCSGHRRRLSSS
ncbi:hypothetical protein KFK09_008076 [Dendrobium nobile]|uniref:Uncharacterized protein n=1 Tax=Dendrobium nobile TaxID=94219 RepID=A0A8T3BVW1_DENNO|nr:hypothetical protein KFK09_008076 [Dendrobium nobile]